MTGITLNLPVPPSVNKIRRVDWLNHRLATKWRESADKFVVAQKRGPLPQFTEPVEILITVSEKAYKGDLDNTAKLLIDQCVRLSLIPDDSPKYLRRLVMEFGDAPDGCTVSLKPMKPSLPSVTGERRRAMLAYIAKHPHGVTVWQILAAVYADDPDGGPTEHNIVCVMAKAINKQIEPQGYRITAARGGPGSLYTLTEIGPETQAVG